MMKFFSPTRTTLYLMSVNHRNRSSWFIKCRPCGTLRRVIAYFLIFNKITFRSFMQAGTKRSDRLPCLELQHYGRDTYIPTKKLLLPFKVYSQFATNYSLPTIKSFVRIRC
ncbi:MAG: hypothetical protein LBC02_04425 [Planctomycetaceae bacterium]|nr:hypothetical protein [Planctomycetaceae bacterium]